MSFPTIAFLISLGGLILFVPTLMVSVAVASRNNPGITNDELVKNPLIWLQSWAVFGCAIGTVLYAVLALVGLLVQLVS